MGAGNRAWHCSSYLDDVEDDVLVETVEDALGDPVVAPRSVDQQQLLQVGELAIREEGGGRGGSKDRL